MVAPLFVNKLEYWLQTKVAITANMKKTNLMSINEVHYLKIQWTFSLVHLICNQYHLFSCLFIQK